MKVIRWIGIVLGVLVLLVASVAVVARFSDGPMGPFQGGPLVEGRLVGEPVGDWSFVAPIGEVELQLLHPARSRTTWILFHEGVAYIPCGLPNFRLWKQWPHQAMADGRGLVRIGGERYRVELARVEDPELQSTIREKLREKYPESNVYSGEVWHFELRPPASASG